MLQRSIGDHANVGMRDAILGCAKDGRNLFAVIKAKHNESGNKPLQ
jgi:hypothetical protein